MTNILKADGIELDSFASWIGVGSNRWSVPAAKGENVSVPARHGSLYVADKTFEEGEFSLEVIVQGADASGRVSDEALTQTRENLDRLLRIFTKRKKLIHFEQTLDNGELIECYAECVGAFDVTRTSAALPFARFTVGLKVPRAFWQDSEARQSVSHDNLSLNEGIRLPEFVGGSAPMDDGIYVVHGPVSGPQLTIVETGAYTRLENTIPEGWAWKIDAARWTSQMGPDVDLFTDGPSVIGKTVHGGSSSLMDLPPIGSKYDPAIEIAGDSIGRPAYLEVRGRRKHIVG